MAALCEQELAHRHSERLRRYLKESHLPVTKTLERFDFAACPALNPVRIAQFARYPDWVERRENLLLFGPSGVGKTHLAAAIGHGLIEQGLRVYFSATTALVQSLQQAKQQLRLAEVLQRLDKYAVLVLDDLGYVRKSDTETAVLFELIARSSRDRQSHRHCQSALQRLGWSISRPDDDRRCRRPPGPPRAHHRHPSRQLPQESVAQAAGGRSLHPSRLPFSTAPNPNGGGTHELIRQLLSPSTDRPF